MEINQFYSTGVRFISTASITPNLDAKLIAFYTILTGALSIMLSFRQSRCMLINNYTTYPLIKVKKCFKCLKRTKKQESKVITNSNNNNNNTSCKNNNNNKNNNESDSNTNDNNNINDKESENKITKNTNSDASYVTASYLYNSASYYTNYLKLKSLKRLTLATLSTGSRLFKKMNSGFYCRASGGGIACRQHLRQIDLGAEICKHRKVRRHADRVASFEYEKSYCETCQSLKYSSEAFSTTMPVFPSVVAPGFHRSLSVPAGLSAKPKKYNTKVNAPRFDPHRLTLSFSFMHMCMITLSDNIFLNRGQKCLHFFCK